MKMKNIMNQAAELLGCFVGVALVGLVAYLVYNNGIAYEFNLPQLDYLTITGTFYVLRCIFKPKTK